MSRDRSTLRYVSASQVRCRAADLSGVDLLGRDNEKLGSLKGLLIDPASCRLRFYVVEAAGWLRSRNCLLPTETPACVDAEGKVLHVEADRDDLKHCETFERSSVLPYSDEDLVRGIFRPA